MGDLNSQDYHIQIKSGLQANILATATIYQAITGELHYATDTKQLYIFDGTTMVRVSLQKTIVTKTADYTATIVDSVILCDTTSSSIIITLMAASTFVGIPLTIKKISAANTMTIDGDASELIDGSLTQTVTSQWTSLTICSNGTSWYIL
jgi:hypothetical protein